MRWQGSWCIPLQNIRQQFAALPSVLKVRCFEYGDPAILLNCMFQFSKYIGKWLASGTHSGRVVVWNMVNGDAVQEFRVGSGDNYEVAWSHDGSLLSASFVNGALVVIQTSDFLRSSSNSSDVSSTGSVSQT